MPPEEGGLGVELNDAPRSVTHASHIDAIDPLRKFLQHCIHIFSETPRFLRYCRALHRDDAPTLCNIRKQMDEFIKNARVEKIPTVDRPFDPAVHEAVGHETEQEKPDHAVLREVRPGYTMGQTVLYPAMVVINKKM